MNPYAGSMMDVGRLTEEQQKNLSHLKPEQIARLHQDPTLFKPAKVKASRDIPIGYELEPTVKWLTLDKMRLYLFGNGWPKTSTSNPNRHTDYAGAWHTGMPRPIVMANQIGEYWAEMMIKFFGTGYIGGTLEWTAIHVPFADDVYTNHLVVSEKVVEGDKMRIKLDAWSENQNGEKVLVGTVTGLVD
ncbi:hypothetical protein ACFLUF_00860 [Chloroflexota bacterium]